jgi:hypothetical protein
MIPTNVTHVFWSQSQVKLKLQYLVNNKASIFAHIVQPYVAVWKLSNDISLIEQYKTIRMETYPLKSLRMYGLPPYSHAQIIKQI